MRLPALLRGRIVRRYKRFLADVELADGTLITAHCPNTGSMATCWEPGAAVEVSRSDNPRRKLQWTLERVDMGAGWIGVNTGLVNRVVEEAVLRGRIPALSGYATLRREVTMDVPGHKGARLDILLADGPNPDAFVEVKNVTLLVGRAVRFPDAVSVRGRKHLDALAEAVRLGYRGVMLFAVNRPEGVLFAPAWDIDNAYAERLRQVVGAGVEVLAVRIRHTENGLEVSGSLDVELQPDPDVG